MAKPLEARICNLILELLAHTLGCLCGSPTVIAAAITSRFQKHSIPTHIQLEQEVRGLRRNSVILLEQVRTIDRMRLKRYIGSLNGSMMQKVDRAILISFGLKEQNRA